MSNTCPVCFYAGLHEPAYHAVSGNGSDEICPCCGYQFGYDDWVKKISFDQWRQQWIAENMPWFSKGRKPPENWNPAAQLASGGVRV